LLVTSYYVVYFVSHRCLLSFNHDISFWYITELYSQEFTGLR